MQHSYHSGLFHNSCMKKYRLVAQVDVAVNTDDYAIATRLDFNHNVWLRFVNDLLNYYLITYLLTYVSVHQYNKEHYHTLQ